MNSINKISFTSRDLIHKFSHGLILNILIRIKGFVYLPILVNFLSKEDVGLISLARSLSGLLLGFFLLNIPDSANRVILGFEKENNQGKIRESINSIFFFIVLLFFVFGFILIYMLESNNYQSSAFTAVLMLLIFAGVIKKLSSYVFQIFQNTRLLLFTELVIEYTSFFIVILILIKHLYYTPLNVLHVYVVCVLGGSLFLLYKLNKTYKIRFEFNIRVVWKVLKISMILLPSAYSLLIIQNSDFIIIEKILGLNPLGEYSFAYSIAGVVSGLAMAITFFWYSSVVYARREQMVSLIMRVNYLLPGLLIATIIFFYFLTEPVINLINKDYLPSNGPIQILIVGFFINLITQIYSGVLYALKKEMYILISVLLGAILNIVLNLLFIKHYGIVFAAFSTSLSYMLIYLLYVIFTMKFIGELIRFKFIVINLLIVIISLGYILYNYLLWI